MPGQELLVTIGKLHHHDIQGIEGIKTLKTTPNRPWPPDPPVAQASFCVIVFHCST